ncbi:MAG: PAC2 family protein [Methanocellales archaeon]
MEIRIYKKLELNQPIMLAGAPGMGLVAKQVVDYCIAKLHSELIGAIPAPYDHQPIAIFDKYGLLQPLRQRDPYRFYISRRDDKRDLIFFSADLQPSLPERQNELADVVALAAMQLNVRRIYTTAALPVPTRVDVPRIYGVASKPELMSFLTDRGVIPMAGEVSGFNGVLIEYAWRRGIEAICLLGETYVYHIGNPYDPVDYKASLALVKKLSELEGFEIDTAELESEAKRCDERIRGLEREFEKKTQALKSTDDLRYIG